MADIPRDVAEALDITVIPLRIHFQKEAYVDATSVVPTKLHYGQETFLDGVTMLADEFYERLETAVELPSTSIPEPKEFAAKYRQIAQQDAEQVHIISIHISSSLSKTMETVLAAKAMVRDEVEVTAVDSKSATYGLGMIVVAAARAAQAGQSVEECLRIIEDAIQNSTVFFLVDRLEYLQRTGRIGMGQAILGFLMRVKPILSLNEQGAVYPISRVKGRQEALSRFRQLAQEYAAGHKVEVAIVQSRALKEALELKEAFMQTFSLDNILITDIGPVVGRYVGPQTLAVVIRKIGGKDNKQI